MKQWWTWAKSGRGQSNNPATGPKDGKGQQKTGSKKRLSTAKNAGSSVTSNQSNRSAPRCAQNTPGVKRHLTRNGDDSDENEANSNREVLCADGQASVAGLQGHYICDVQDQNTKT